MECGTQVQLRGSKGRGIDRKDEEFTMNDFVVGQKVQYMGPAPTSKREYIDRLAGKVGVVVKIEDKTDWVHVRFQDETEVRTHFTDFEPVYSPIRDE